MPNKAQCEGTYQNKGCKVAQILECREVGPNECCAQGKPFKALQTQVSMYCLSTQYYRLFARGELRERLTSQIKLRGSLSSSARAIIIYFEMMAFAE